MSMKSTSFQKPKSVLGLIGIVFLVVIVAMASVQIYQWAFSPSVSKLASSVGLESPEQQKAVAAAVGVSETDLASCNGIAAINALYNDKNAFNAATDPATNMTVFEANGKDFSKLVADDATSTTVPIKSEIKALAGNTNGVPDVSYFGKEISFSSGCADVAVQEPLFQAGAPTMTLTNDNGVTLNSDSAAEATNASSTYSPTMTVKAPAKKSSSEYGAAVVFEYDATYVQKIESSSLEDFSTTILLAHVTNQSSSNADFDQFKVMKFPGTLRDNQKVDIDFTVTTTSTEATEDLANVKVYWLPLNKDLNSYDLKSVILGLYDNDNNAIYPTSNSVYYYTD